MFTRVLAIAFAALGLNLSQAEACSCSDWQNAQQSAQNPETLVAKVETIQSSSSGVSILKIQEMFQGEISSQEIKVVSQNGENCNGEVIRDKKVPWIVLLNRTAKGFETLTCADTAYRIDPENQKVQFSFQESENFEVSLKDFQKILKLKAVPTVKKMICSVDVRRTHISPTGPYVPNELDFEFFGSVESVGMGPISETIDFSNQALRMGKMELSVQSTPIGTLKYLVSATVEEPFFSEHMEQVTLIDISRSYAGAILRIDRATDIEGNPLQQVGERPFLTHQTFIDCALSVGLPLIYFDKNKL